MSLQPEDTVTHRVFGELRWEAESGWWFAQVRDSTGEWIDVIVQPDGEDRAACLDRAADLYLRAVRAERQLLRTATAHELLELHNDTWRRSDEPELAADEFMSRLEFTFIKIRPDWERAVVLSYHAGALFGGHSVDVEVDGELRFLGIDLVG
jgi:hypothetical protein